MKLSAMLLAFVTGLTFAASIEVGTADSPSNKPWCGD